MKRNIAFFITANSENSFDFIKAKNHFLDLAHCHNHQIFQHKISTLQILIIYAEKVTLEQSQSTIRFLIGHLGEKQLHHDRYLKIIITPNRLIIENDYSGSIPVFYANKKQLSLSNIEPCVMLDTNTKVSDFSYKNIYGFLRFSHFIWDEAAYQHIYMMQPDSKYQFNNDDFILEKKIKIPYVFKERKTSFQTVKYLMN